MPESVIVVPCYNEADRLDLETIIRYAMGREHLLLFVNDGSTDATGPILTDLVAADPDHLAVLHLAENCGKAEAVRQGVLRAWDHQPQYVGYWDADLATPLETIDEFVEYLDTHQQVDILLGARVRLLGRQIQRRATRHCLGRLFATAAAATLRLPVYDTQCGAKLFRANSRTRVLFAEPFLTKWLFDVELLARYMNSTPDSDAQPNVHPTVEQAIHELPLTHWRDVDGSKVKPTDFLRAVWQLATIYRTYQRRPTPAGQPTAPSTQPQTVRPPQTAPKAPPPRPVADSQLAAHAGERI